MDHHSSHLRCSATIPVIGQAAYRTARQKLQGALTALSVRETERAQVVAEFSLLYRALAIGDAIELTLVGHPAAVDLAVHCSTTPETARRVRSQLHLFEAEAAHGSEDPLEHLRLKRWLRTTGAPMDREKAQDWLQETTAEEMKLKAIQTEEANAAKREFLSRMSHELRTPMNAIIGMTHLALRTDLDRRQRDYLEKIRSAGQNLLGIINDVLDFSKIEAGKLSLENTDFQLDKVLEDVTNLVAEKIASKGVELLFSVDEQVPDELNGDPLRLTQILLNLLSNASKFTEKGQITLRVSVLERASEWVDLQFEVADSGIGMSEAQMANLFQAFSQADISTTRRYGGTGLGLSICQRLLELMGGSITVSSVPGEGSCFRARARFGLGQRTPGPVMPLELNQLQVLVVDDNPVACEVMQGMLAHLPVRQQTAASGEQALLLVEEANRRAQPFGLVLLDWELGDGIAGLEVARRIRGLAGLRQPKIVLVTAQGRDDSGQEASGGVVDAWLAKPVRPSDLIDMLVGLFAQEGQGEGGRAAHRSGAPWHQASGNEPEAWNLNGVRVLLVEDNPINQQIACELLAIAGVQVATAPNGVEALAWLETQMPSAAPDSGLPCDLVLMDLNMPEMDGWECTRRIRSDSRWDGLPVLAMTAHAMQQERDRCLALGMQDHITKPIEPDRLYERLRHWSGRGGSASETAAGRPGPEPAVPASGQELLAALDGFDCDQALRRVAGNTALYLRLLRSLLHSQADAMERLERALERQDLKEAEAIVHTVKGVAGNLGATALAEAASSLDAELKRGSSPAHLRQAFGTQLERTLQTLRRAFPEQREQEAQAEGASAVHLQANPGQGNPGQANPASAAELTGEQRELLQTLENYLRTSDGEAMELVETSGSALIAILGAATYNALVEQVQRFNFPDALACLQRHHLSHPHSDL
jgi:two-component system sensor histidine kinase/response regulator